jgi:hypothetical protein
MGQIKSMMGLFGSPHKILDRWALNSPDALRTLESVMNNTNCLIQRLKQQDLLESRALCSDEASRLMSRGMSRWEILEMQGVDTELRIHPRMSWQEIEEAVKAVEIQHRSMYFEGEDDELEEARKVLYPLTIASIQEEPWYCEEVWTLLNHWATAFTKELKRLEESWEYLEQTVTLSKARKVLSLETIEAMRKKMESPQDYQRLNLWAKLSPDMLKRVEAKGILERIFFLEAAHKVQPFSIEVLLSNGLLDLGTHIHLLHWAITSPDWLREVKDPSVLNMAIMSASESETDLLEMLERITG